jgi:hemoglobin
LVTEFICEKTGGPQKYTGKSMKEAHKHMKITDREWQQLVALLKVSFMQARKRMNILHY